MELQAINEAMAENPLSAGACIGDDAVAMLSVRLECSKGRGTLSRRSVEASASIATRTPLPWRIASAMRSCTSVSLYALKAGIRALMGPMVETVLGFAR